MVFGKRFQSCLYVGLSLSCALPVGCHKMDRNDRGDRRPPEVQSPNQDRPSTGLNPSDDHSSDDTPMTDGGSSASRTVSEIRAEAQSNAAAASGPTATVRLLETTDLHVWMENFDYYQNKATPTYGLVRTATLIAQARAENPQAFLVDNGDVIQGNPLGDYAFSGMDLSADTHPVYKAMNALSYDVGNIGNHEFNYGLQHLRASLSGARFPYISANTYIDDGDGDLSNDRSFLPPYQITEKTIALSDGSTKTIKVGFMGFVPPQILIWDKSNLTGRLRAVDMVDRARALVDEMRSNGADIVIAVPHSGISAAPRQGGDENAVYYLSQILGIDGILCGHSHQVFPSATYSNIPNTDLTRGLINGIPVVMPGQWGSHLGVVDFEVKATNSGWAIVGATATTRSIAPLAESAADATVRSAVAADHAATIAYLGQEVGETATRIQSYFSMVKPSYAVQLINDSQKWYVQSVLRDDPTQYQAIRDLPVLSASAPLKAGGKPDNYTDVAAGHLTLRSIADMYVYPNTLKVVKISGAQVVEWLEMAAGAFNTIRPATADTQLLLNPLFPGYNFDVISGVTYSIDVSQPARYNKMGQLVNPNSHRIVSAQYLGQPIAADQFFLVATNNYRASGGGNFPGLDGSSIVIDSTKENREILRDYIEEVGTIGASIDNNWLLLPVSGATQVILRTAPRAREILPELSTMVSDVGDETDPTAAGFARFLMRWQ